MKDAETFGLPLLAEIPIKIDLRQTGADGAASGHRFITPRTEPAGAVPTPSLARLAQPRTDGTARTVSEGCLQSPPRKYGIFARRLSG